MSSRTATRLAGSVWALSLALTALSLLLLALNLSHPGVHIFDYWFEDTAIAVACSTVGAFIASRRPESPIGWIFCAIGLVAGVDYLCAEYAIYALLAAPGSLPGGEALAWIRSWIWVSLFGLFVFLALLFPDGRLPSVRWRWFAWLTVAVVLTGAIAVAFSPGPVDGLGPIHNPLGSEGMRRAVDPVRALLYPLGLVGAASLFVRLRRAKGVERQQLKWITYAAVVGAGGAVLTYVVSRAVSVWWVWWVGFALLAAGIVGIPIAVGIAIMRYRLYNIDLIINRTLVYSALTAALALVYFVDIVVLQEAFRALTGQTSQLAVVASTLVIAALFNPLRRRIQSFIDRRFYRRKYDAAKTLEAFSAKLREETDLDRWGKELVSVVRETMQPAHVSLWLRSSQEVAADEEALDQKEKR